MKRKLGITCDLFSDITPEETLPLIKKAGFDAYATSHTDMERVKRIKKIGDSLGLELDYIHAPFDRINEMWRRGLDYLPVSKAIKNTVDVAAENGVKTVVIHVSHRWKAPEINEIGIARFDEIIFYAAERNVNIAIENVYSIGNVAYFGDRYKNISNVGFCYDCGHEHCFTKTVSWLDVFPNNTLTVHINDNLGRGDKKEGNNDMHQLPFDGDIDYTAMMKKLNRNKYEGALILEVSKYGHEDLSNEEFLNLAYERLKRISELE